MDLVHNWSLDLWANWTDKLKRSSLSDEVETPAFTSFNARLAWQPAKNLELSLTGRNLLDSRHQEFVAENLITETQVERSIFAQVRWKF
jgi:iron complex outermembrane receptor protein